MKALDQEWFNAVGAAIGKTDKEVFLLIRDWWNENKPLSYINAELTRMAAANGKTLILVDQDNN